MVPIQCPACKVVLEIERKELGSKVTCGDCRSVFFAESYDPNRPDPTRAMTTLHQESRRRRFEENYDEDESDLSSRTIQSHAKGLYYTGIGGLVLSPILGLGYCLLAGILNAKAGESFALLVSGVMATVGGCLYFLTMTVAAAKSDRSTNWAYTAAILGTASIVLCGPCLPVTWAAFPYGILLLLALNRQSSRRSY